MSIGLIGASLALCIRLLLGGVFLFGGMAKLKNSPAFEGALRSLVGTGWSRPFLSRALPLLEAMLGALLDVASRSAHVCRPLDRGQIGSRSCRELQSQPADHFGLDGRAVGE